MWVGSQRFFSGVWFAGVCLGVCAVVQSKDLLASETELSGRSLHTREVPQSTSSTYGLSLKALLDPSSLPVSDIGSVGGQSGVRLEMIRDAAMALGLRHGSADEAKKIVADIEKRATDLDRLFKFQVLFTEAGVFIPPVIQESRDAVTTDGRVMRVSSRIYKILERGRLAFNPPSWRDYLYVGLNTSEVPLPSAAVFPKNDMEKKVWDDAIIQGWSEGVRQSQEVFEINFARLERDFTGIMLYESLRERGLITNEVVAEQSIVVEGNENEMTLNQRVYQITNDPGLVTNDQQWKPLVKSGDDR